MLSVGLAFGGGPNSIIKSIQEVEITIAAASTSNTATLSTTVDKSKSIILFQGRRTASTSNRDEINCRVELTNNTTVTAAVNSASTNASDRVVRAVVVEFHPWVIKNIKHGTITIGSLSNSAVDFPLSEFGSQSADELSAAPSVAIHLGETTTNNGDSGRIASAFGNAQVYFSQVGASFQAGILAGRGANSGSVTIGYCLVQFQPGIVRAVQPGNAFTQITSGNAFGTRSLAQINSASKVLTALGGWSYVDGFTTEEILGFLVDETSLRAERNSSYASSGSILLQAVEFYPKWIKSRQSNQSAMDAGVATKDITITAVDTSKSFVHYLGHKTTNAFSNTEYTIPTVKLESSTAVRLARATGTDFGYVPTVSFEVIEFY